MFLVGFPFVFVLFRVWLSDSENHCFPCNFSVFLSRGLASLFGCFILTICLFMNFFSYQNKKTPPPPKKNGHGKDPEQQMQKKLTRHFFSASAVVFTNSVPNLGGGLKNVILLKSL